MAKSNDTPSQSIGDPIEKDADELADEAKNSPVVSPYDIYDEDAYLINMQNRLLEVIDEMNPHGMIGEFAVCGMLQDLIFQIQYSNLEEEDE